MTYLGQNIKKLGFGLMRLPMIGLIRKCHDHADCVIGIVEDGF